MKYPHTPGVPAAGHITAGGWWHPGRADGCAKCEPSKPEGQRLNELRRSGAAGPHQDKRTKRNRSRSDRRRNAITDQDQQTKEN